MNSVEILLLKLVNGSFNLLLNFEEKHAIGYLQTLSNVKSCCNIIA